jgi:endonuclease III
MENATLKAVLETLLNTYGQPVWRDRLPPIDELVSTILSQNTNDINRDRAFHSLRRRFPTWDAVRKGEEGEIVAAIRVAGLAAQKGPRIKTVLEQIHAETGGLDLSFLAEMPVEEARAWLLRFKGVGLKTAAIVLLFSLGMPAFPVDTHIYRVTGRLGARPVKLDLEKTHRLMEEMIDPRDYYAGHLNLIRLGREVCQARKPRCLDCPVAGYCEYPGKPSKEGTKSIHD